MIETGNSNLRFNPCFGGSYIVTGLPAWLATRLLFSFNPCFGGSYIVTLEWPCKTYLGYYGFQSLFWWILYCDKYARQNTYRRFVVFQSLFWWILYCDPANQWNSEIIQANVSILVLVDLILWPMWFFGCLLPIILFQSLFWWILYCDF